MSVIIEAANITATTLGKVIVDTHKAGGNPYLILLSIIGLFAILSSVIRDSSKTLGALFIVCIAAPILGIEYLYKKWKKSKEIKE